MSVSGPYCLIQVLPGPDSVVSDNCNTFEEGRRETPSGNCNTFGEVRRETPCMINSVRTGSATVRALFGTGPISGTQSMIKPPVAALKSLPGLNKIPGLENIDESVLAGNTFRQPVHGLLGENGEDVGGYFVYSDVLVALGIEEAGNALPLRARTPQRPRMPCRPPPRTARTAPRPHLQTPGRTGTPRAWSRRTGSGPTPPPRTRCGCLCRFSSGAPDTARTSWACWHSCPAGTTAARARGVRTASEHRGATNACVAQAILHPP